MTEKTTFVKRDLLTYNDGRLLGMLGQYVNEHRYVELAVGAYDPDDDDAFRRLEGTLRHFVTGPDNYGFPGNKVDLRDQYVRMTTKSGMDITFSVAGFLEADTVIMYVRDGDRMVPPQY